MPVDPRELGVIKRFQAAIAADEVIPFKLLQSELADLKMKAVPRGTAFGVPVFFPKASDLPVKARLCPMCHRDRDTKEVFHGDPEDGNAPFVCPSCHEVRKTAAVIRAAREREKS